MFFLENVGPRALAKKYGGDFIWRLEEHVDDVSYVTSDVLVAYLLQMRLYCFMDCLPLLDGFVAFF